MFPVPSRVGRERDLHRIAAGTRFMRLTSARGWPVSPTRVPR